MAPVWGWGGLNLLISVASFVFALGTLLTLVNFVVSHTRVAGHRTTRGGPTRSSGRRRHRRPTTTSPPFPVVTSRHPLWDDQPLPVPQTRADDPTAALGVSGALERQMTVTEGMDADPQESVGIPEPTYLPFVVAVGIACLFVGLLTKAVVVGAVGVAIGAVAIVHWTWRTSENLR